MAIMAVSTAKIEAANELAAEPIKKNRETFLHMACGHLFQKKKKRYNLNLN